MQVPRILSYVHFGQIPPVMDKERGNIIQLLTGDEGNIWYVGPEDKMLPEAEGRGQHFVWRSNISYVARIPCQ